MSFWNGGMLTLDSHKKREREREISEKRKEEE